MKETLMCGLRGRGEYLVANNCDVMNTPLASSLIHDSLHPLPSG
jgi:hypothetical protein